MFVVETDIDYSYCELRLAYHLKLRPLVQVILGYGVQFLKDGLSGFEYNSVGVGRLADVFFIDMSG